MIERPEFSGRFFIMPEFHELNGLKTVNVAYDWVPVFFL